jgi:anti-anti-sigma factor
MTPTMIKPSLFEIDIEWDGERARVIAAGELDLATSPQLELEMRTILERGAREVTVDLAKLTFVDSSGLRVLIDLHELSQQDGWGLSLTLPSEQARAVFRISGAEEHLPFVDGVQDVSENAETVNKLEMTDRAPAGSEEEENPSFAEEGLA